MEAPERRRSMAARAARPTSFLSCHRTSMWPSGRGDFLVSNFHGNLGGNAQRTRHALNADTIREMHAAFRRGGRAAIDKVMKQQPAVFLKLLLLLVPRDMRVEHSGTIKQMSDEQIEEAIAAIKAMLAAQAGEAAKVIEGEAEVVPSLSAPSTPTTAS